jgi:hypothetical protein
MSPSEIDLIERHFGPYSGLPEYGPALRLIEHVRELQRFVGDLAEHYARPGGPEKTAEHYQLVRRCEALRQQFQPVRAGVAYVRN